MEAIVMQNNQGTHKIVKVRKNPDGDITQVMLDDGTVHAVKDAIKMAQQNQLQNVIVGQAKNGRQTLRSKGNDIKSDNLSNLPMF
jgi:hypothetical protein